MSARKLGVLLLVVCVTVVGGAVWVLRDRLLPGFSVADGNETGAFQLQNTQPLNRYDDIKDDGCSLALADYRLLAGSEVLKRQGVEVFVAQPTQGGIQIPYLCPESKLADFHLIRAGGLVRLEGDPKLKNDAIPWGCGEDFPAAKLNLPGHPPDEQLPFEDLFVATGNRAPKVLTWYPAQESTETRLECPGEGQGFSLQNAVQFQVAGLDRRFELGIWEHIRHLQDDGFCISESGQAAEVFLYSIGIATTNANECSSLFRSALDCTHVPEKGKIAIRKILGLLKASDGSGSEEWLLLDSPGYEGAGVTAIPFSSPADVDEEKLEFVVYSGC